MPKFIDRTGLRYQRLVVTSRCKGKHPKKTYWECECDCGQKLVVAAGNLASGNTGSCGCLQVERASEANRTHGRVSDSVWQIWQGINRRCLSPGRANYSDYGGRGIEVCGRWSRETPGGFENFLADMGERPSKRHSIDRIDNDGNYSPENCRWATQTEQANNQRRNVTFTHNGRTQTITQWARETGVNISTAFKRIYRGYAPAVALELEGPNQ